MISDGDLGRESANGTWLSVTNYYEKKDNQRNESSMIRLENESEIKISDSLLKFEMFNFSKTKPKYTKKQCAENNFKYIESFFQTD